MMSGTIGAAFEYCGMPWFRAGEGSSQIKASDYSVRGFPSPLSFEREMLSPDRDDGEAQGAAM